MTINKKYKPAFKAVEDSGKGEIVSEIDNVEGYDIYEYIMDNLYIMSKNLSDPNESIILDTLQWFRETFYKLYYVLPADIIIQIFNLIYSSNESISKEALRVVGWACSFQSNMQDVLLENGLLDFLVSNFPEKCTLNLFYNLAALSESSREILIDSGYVEILKSINDPQMTFILATQLYSLVNLPFQNPIPELMSDIFTAFSHIWSNFQIEDRKYSELIIKATNSLLRSNDNFLYAFMEMRIYNYFLEVPEDLNEDDDFYLLSLFKMLTFIINQNEKFAVDLINNKVCDLVEEIVTNDYENFPFSVPKALNFLTDLIFYRPDITENIYDREIPHSVVDILDDLYSDGECMIEAISFVIVMMAMSSPMIFAQLKYIGCYTMLVSNIMSVEEIYWKWAIRVLFRGFVVDKVEENDENRQFLSSCQELVGWLDNLKNDESDEIRNAALQLLVKIFPDYENENDNDN